MVKCTQLCLIILSGFAMVLANEDIKSPIIPCEKGELLLKEPGFTAVFRNTSSNITRPEYFLVVSAFSGIPFSKDSVYYVKDVARLLRGDRTLDILTLNADMTWPNEIGSVPGKLFSTHHNLIAIADGFLVPTKGKGAVTVFDLDSKTPSHGLDITTQHNQKEDWFYHKAMWFDMNVDGRLDLLTCRAHVSLLGSHRAELVWFSPPADVSQPWEPHVIAEGPDVNFSPILLHDGNITYGGLVCAQFFTQKLTLFWTEDLKGDWSNSSQVKSRVVSDTLGPAFDLRVSDVNADGKPDILVTSNSASGSVIVFEVPQDFRSGGFQANTIATGFKPDAKGPGKGAPGTAIPVIPGPKYNSSKPLLVLSGDDDGNAYILSPDSDAPGNWSYTTSIFSSPGGTVGGISAVDVTGDDYVELFVPAYNKGKILVFSFDC